MKLVEVQSAKEFAESFLPDIFFRMAVNRVLDNVPAVEGVTIQQWIPVTERLPERNGEYLVCTLHDFYKNTKVAKASFKRSSGGFYGNGGHWSNVTHWMPLPEPPKEE